MPVPGHKFVDTALRPAVREASDEVGEVGLGIGAVQLAAQSNRKTGGR